MAPVLRPALERRLRAEQAGKVRFDAFTRGRYIHRRIALSDHAARGGDAAHNRGSRSGDRNLPLVLIRFGIPALREAEITPDLILKVQNRADENKQ
jgi:hypothetical protein